MLNVFRWVYAYMNTFNIRISLVTGKISYFIKKKMFIETACTKQVSNFKGGGDKNIKGGFTQFHVLEYLLHLCLKVV